MNPYTRTYRRSAPARFLLFSRGFGGRTAPSVLASGWRRAVLLYERALSAFVERLSEICELHDTADLPRVVDTVTEERLSAFAGEMPTLDHIVGCLDCHSVRRRFASDGSCLVCHRHSVVDLSEGLEDLIMVETPKQADRRARAKAARKHLSAIKGGKG